MEIDALVATQRVELLTGTIRQAQRLAGDNKDLQHLLYPELQNLAASFQKKYSS